MFGSKAKSKPKDAHPVAKLNSMPITFERLFKLGMKRDLPQLKSCPYGKLEIAVGESGAYQSCERTHGYPEWWWPRDKLPYKNGEVGLIHCYHFLEHLKGEDAISFLQEAQRVLCYGGILQFCIPKAGSEISFQDLTHKSFWTGDSFKILFNNPYYDPNEGQIKWEFDVHYLVMAGIVERNIVLLGQLVKVPKK